MTVIYNREKMRAKVVNVFYLFFSEIHVAEVPVFAVPQTKIF